MRFNSDIARGMHREPEPQEFVGEPPLRVSLRDGVVVVEQGQSLRALFTRLAPGELRALELPGVGAVRAVLAALQASFAWEPTLQVCTLDLSAAPLLLQAALTARGVCERDGQHSERVRCERAAITQLPELWSCAPRAAGYPQRLIVTDGKRHPQRPPKPSGRVYQRRVSGLGSLTFRVAEPAVDLPAFCRWMNDPRVSRIWELAGPEASLAQYLENIGRDPHTLPLIGEWDAEPFGYFELYWAKEDRIAPFYAAGDYDRGVHVLVGEQRFRGPQRVAAWLCALAHYAFLDDPRTQHVVAEPRADNAKMIAYFTLAGFHREKAFDFPHKRAALMNLPREVFFDEHCP